MYKYFILTVALFFTNAIATPLAGFIAATPERLSQKLPLPGNDTWYAAPSGYESQPLGAILKNRTVPSPVSITSISPIKIQLAIQLQYRTQNSVGDPIASVVTVLVPYSPDYTKLLVQAWFSDSACPDCNPSLALQTEANINNTFYKQQFAPVVAFLNQGWIVSVADDGGPQAAFPSGLMAGYGTLDSIRAVLQSSSLTKVSTTPTIAISGYSGGGITAAWTTELQPSYAPELKITAVALGGLIPNFRVLQSTYLSTF